MIWSLKLLLSFASQVLWKVDPLGPLNTTRETLIWIIQSQYSWLSVLDNLHSILVSSVVICTQAVLERSDIRQTNAIRKHAFLQETVARNLRDWFHCRGPKHYNYDNLSKVALTKMKRIISACRNTTRIYYLRYHWLPYFFFVPRNLEL